MAHQYICRFAADLLLSLYFQSPKVIKIVSGLPKVVSSQNKSKKENQSCWAKESSYTINLVKGNRPFAVAQLLLPNYFSGPYVLHGRTFKQQSQPLLMHKTHPKHFQEGWKVVKEDFCDLKSGYSGKITYFYETITYMYICTSDRIM